MTEGAKNAGVTREEERRYQVAFFAILVAKSSSGRIEVISISVFTVLCYNKSEIDRN